MTLTSFIKMVNTTDSFYVSVVKFVQYKNGTQYTGMHFCPTQLEKTGKSQCFVFFVVVVFEKTLFFVQCLLHLCILFLS